MPEIIISNCILILFQVIYEEEIQFDHINIESQGASRLKIIENIFNESFEII